MLFCNSLITEQNGKQLDNPVQLLVSSESQIKVRRVIVLFVNLSCLSGQFCIKSLNKKLSTKVSLFDTHIQRLTSFVTGWYSCPCSICLTRDLL